MDGLVLDIVALVLYLSLLIRNDVVKERFDIPNSISFYNIHL
jgi:hypothetical protein